MDSTNKKALWFIAPAIVVLILVGIIKLMEKPGNAKSNKKQPSIIDPTLKHPEDTITSKGGTYEHGQQVEELNKNKKRLTFEDIGEMAKNNSASTKLGYRQDSLQKGSPFESKALQKPVTRNTQPTSKQQSTYSGNATRYKDQTIQPAIQSASTAPVNTEPTKLYPDIPVYGSNKSGNTSKTSKNDFIPAYLEEDTKIVDKAAVVFILDKDCIINGNQIFKDALLFGTVVNASSRFDIYIHNIKNTDGTTYEFNNVIVFNEKYGRGIVPDGNLSKALKQSADQSANNATGDLGYSQNVGASLAQQGVTNTVSAITSSRQPSVTLAQGYKVFIKAIKS